MIQDLDGATFEPSRRRHVAVLSAAVAAAATVMLYALVAPAPRMDTPPLAESSAPSPVTHTVVTFTTDSTTIGWADLLSIRPDQWGVFIAERPADETWTECAAGIGSSPPVTLVFDREGRRVVAAYTSGQTGRFIPLPKAYVDSGWLSVPCDTSDVFAPRINRAR